MKLKSRLLLFFVVYVIALSFIPVLHDTLLAQDRWLGYGTGAFQYQNQNYFVLFNDPYDGSSKPHIHLNPSFAPAARISLLEFSDWTSWVNDRNLFNEFNATVRADQRTLDVRYATEDLVIHKFVEAVPDSIAVIFESNKEFKAHLELWKWVMTSVNGISIKDVSKPLAIAPTTVIEFEFEEERLQSAGHGRITLSSLPAEMKIWPHEKGFNRISVDFVNSRMVFTVSGSMVVSGASSLVWSYSLLPYVLPAVAICVVALYLLVDRYGRTLKSRVAGHSR